MTQEENNFNKAMEYLKENHSFNDNDCQNAMNIAFLKAYTAAAKWKDEEYKELIKMLVDELNTSKLYHLGITGLETDAEIAKKRKDGDTALIRGIERTIKFVEESIK